MKRTLSVLLVLLFCLSSLSGCAAKDSKQTRHVVEITSSNYWKYVSIIDDTTSVSANSEESLTGSVRGVLDFAYYEDVVVVYEVVYRDSQHGAPIGRYDVKVTLNAAGDADFEVVSAGIAIPDNGLGYADADSFVELYGYYRYICFKSISGTVIYTV